VTCALEHRHGRWTHVHQHRGPHRHPRLPFRSADVDAGQRHGHEHPHAHEHAHPVPPDHGHGHGLVDPTIIRSRAGLRAVALSLGVLAVTAAIQAVVFVAGGSVALLADLIHNGGDALTAIPLGIAFFLRSRRGERWAGYAVVATIFASAMVAGVEAVDRLLEPRPPDHLVALAIAGVIGFFGNEAAAHVRLRAGRRLDSPALLADGHHARIDGFVSLGVVVAAAAVAIGIPRADPVVGLAITILILRITRQAWHEIRRDRVE